MNRVYLERLTTVKDYLSYIICSYNNEWTLKKLPITKYDFIFYDLVWAQQLTPQLQLQQLHQE